MERFKQKLGPLPVWAWAGIGLLAILGYMYIKHTGFFGSGSGSAAAAGPGTSADSGTSSLSGLLGNQGLTPDPVTYAANTPSTDTAFFGPVMTTYDNSGGAGSGPDRGGDTAPPTAPPTYPGQLATVAAFAPIQNYLGTLLPGILTPVPSAPTPTWQTPRVGPR